jgi:hypothetical protein
MEENKKEETKKVEEVKKEFALVQVPTGQELAFQTPEGEIIRTEELLVMIANKLDEVHRSVA